MKRWHIATTATAVLLSAAIAAHVYFLDGLDGSFFAAVYRDDTEYARHYSDRAFRHIKIGESKADVIATLGVPLKEVWSYRRRAVSLPTIEFVGDRVAFVSAGPLPKLNRIRPGMSRADVAALAGPPYETFLIYSRAKHDRSYHVRSVQLSGDRVIGKSSEFYVD